MEAKDRRTFGMTNPKSLDHPFYGEGRALVDASSRQWFVCRLTALAVNFFSFLSKTEALLLARLDDSLTTVFLNS